MAFAHVLEEHEANAAAPDLDSCPDCGDVMVTRGDDKACAGCGTRQPVLVTTAGHDWAFVAKMAVAINRHWQKKGEMGEGLQPGDTGETPVPVTPEQIDQVFSMAFGFPAREADKQIVMSMGGTTDVLAEYMWDHWMGEPENLSIGDVQHEIEYVLGIRDTNYLGEQPHLAKQKVANELIDATAKQLIRLWDELSAEQNGDVGLVLKYFDNAALDILGSAAEQAGIYGGLDDEEWDRKYQAFEGQVYDVVFAQAPEIKAAMHNDAMPPSLRDDPQARADIAGGHAEGLDFENEGRNG